MIILNEAGELLQILIHRKFDFPIACEMQRECKSRVYENGIKRISISLEQVVESHSCAIGAVLVVAALVPDDFNIVLNECSAEVSYFFGPDVLGSYLDKTRLASTAPPSDCSHCFSTHRRSPTGPGCENPGCEKSLCQVTAL